MSKVVNCPACGKAVTWDTASKWRPFCSERCSLIDLGDWANETNRIPADESETVDGSDEDEPHSQ
jgi:hypothetical protein